MKLIIAVTVLCSQALALSLDAAATKKQAVFETFEHPNPGGNKSCGEVVTCPDALPGPSNGLTFSNLYAVFTGYSRPSGLAAYDQYFYAGVSNTSNPVILSDKYAKSCVQSWTLSSLAAGCSSTQNETDPSSGQVYKFTAGANCSLHLIGKDGSGKTVGEERFSYNPGPLQFNNQGFPQWYMSDFNTTASGLKGKAIQSLSIYVKNIPPKNNPSDVYVGGFQAGLDAIRYTLTNRTQC